MIEKPSRSSKAGEAFLNASIIGCGAVTQDVYALYLPQVPGLRVAVVSDLSEQSARRAAEAFGARVGDVDEAIAAADLVIIATPPDSHASLARRCLSSGRDVCLEKPFVTSKAEATELVTLAETVGRRIYVAQFRRLFPKVALARELIASGAFGFVRSIHMHEGGRFNWQVVSDYISRALHGGVLYDTGAHTLDMGLFVAGLDCSACEVKVESTKRDRPEPSHEIDARFSLQCEGETVKCRLHLSRVQPLANLVRVVCDRAAIEFDLDHSGYVRLITQDHRVNLAPTTSLSSAEHGFALQYLDLLQNGADSVIAARRFVNQIAILEAIHAS
jgi:predicted dehydrogenase